MFSGTPPRSSIVSPPSMPPATKQLNYILPREAGRRPQGAARRCRLTSPSTTMTTTDYINDNDGKAGGFGVGCVTTVMHNEKRQARSPIYHFKRLLEEACPNHTYPIRHKLKDYDMMKSFMISRSLTWGTELDEDSGRSDMIPFPGEDAVMMVYGGRPPPRRHRMSNLSLRGPNSLRLGTWGHRVVKAQVFQGPYIYICEYVYYNHSKGQKKEQKMVGADSLRPRAWRPAQA
jgi:hypothetical protein